MGDHTSKKKLKKGKVYPGDPEKKMFSTKKIFAKKTKIGKQNFLGVAQKIFLSKIIFF